MDLKQLVYFERVAEMGSFTRAALALDIAQPAISRQIRRLEVELKQNLLNRNGRGVSTTEAGELLLHHCRGILHQVELAREDLGRARDSLAGRVNLGVPPSVSRVMTVPLTRHFRQQLPDASLSITENLSLMIKRWLLDGRLDIALLYNPTHIVDVELVPLTREPLYVVRPAKSEADKAPAEPITLKELAKLPLVIPNRPHTVRMLLENSMAEQGYHPNILLEIDAVPAILDLVGDGIGHALLTRHAILTSPNPDKYVLQPIESSKLVSRLYLATASARVTTMTQQAALQLIREQVQASYPRHLQVDAD